VPARGEQTAKGLTARGTGAAPPQYSVTCAPYQMILDTVSFDTGQTE
jgi:hypothetical protein